MGKNCGFFTWELRFQKRLSHKFRRNIETDLDNNFDSDEHPIRVAGVDICFIAEKIFFALNVNKELTKLSKEQKEALFAKFDDDTDRPPPQKKEKRRNFCKILFLTVLRKIVFVLASLGTKLCTKISSLIFGFMEYKMSL